MAIGPIWVHWAVMSGKVGYPVGYWAVDGVLSDLQLPIGTLSASKRPTTYYIYNSYNPNARFAINH